MHSCKVWKSSWICKINVSLSDAQIVEYRHAGYYVEVIN